MTGRAARSAPTFDGSVILRWAAWAAAVVGGLGLGCGTVIGLYANPRTAWFAALELGIPASILGLLAGGLVGTIVAARRMGIER